jgi:hypothetical protein
MHADIDIFGTLDKILGLVPIVGGASAELTKAYVTLKGDLEHPEIEIDPTKGVFEAGKKGVHENEKDVKEAIKEFSKGLEKILRK